MNTKIKDAKNNNLQKYATYLLKEDKFSYPMLFYKIFINYMLKIKWNRISFIFCTALHFIKEFLNSKVSLKNGELAKAVAKKDKEMVFKFTIVAILKISILFMDEIGKMLAFNASCRTYALACANQCQKILSQMPYLFDRFPTANVMANVKIYGESITKVFDTIQGDIVPVTAAIVTYSIATAKVVSVVTGLLLLGVCAIYIFLVYFIHSIRLEQRIKNSIRQDKCEEMLKNILDNQEIIYMNDTNKIEVEKYFKYMEYTQNKETDFMGNNTKLALLLGVFFYLCEMQILIYLLLVKKTLTSGQFLFLGSILGKLHLKLKSISRVLRILSTNLIMTRLKMDMRDHENKVVSVKKENVKSLVKRVHKKEEFKNEWSMINLCYLDLFRNASLTIKKGDKIAIIGKNGVGKTTLLRCMLRHIKTETDLKFDGEPIESFDEIKDSYGYVQQSSTLFNETVLYNLKYGNNVVDSNEIYQKAKELNIHETIKNLKNGYETTCGENGNMLSRGTKQKIVILREWLKERPILLLDEATASIEKADEEKIWERILNEKNLTVVAIMHNLEKIKHFDFIYKIEDKKIKRIGVDELK